MSEWQPIATAPKDDDILVYIPGGVIDVVFWEDRFGWCTYLAEGEESWDVVGYLGAASPTHWMPLPSPPSES